MSATSSPAKKRAGYFAHSSLQRRVPVELPHSGEASFRAHWRRGVHEAVRDMLGCAPERDGSEWFRWAEKEKKKRKR